MDQKNDESQLPLEQLRKLRIEKLQKIKAKGIDPYPSDSSRDTDILKITENFSEYENKTVTVAGRVVSKRDHGKVLFYDLKDMTGQVQIYVRSDFATDTNPNNSELSFADLQLIDPSDFIEVEGIVVKTQRGEVSVQAQKIRVLVKSLRALPENLTDKEFRLRRRYVDTNVNRDVYERFLRRAKFWEAHRVFFKQNGFIEMNIPVLENIPGGADAKPFLTHMDAIDQDFYLRISQELFLKRLIGAGYEKVYEIGPRFRNEGLSDEHLPEHMAMEFYWAYANWNDGMQFIEKLFDYVISQVYPGKKIFRIRGFDVDFSNGWQKLDFGKVMNEKFGFDIYDPTLKQVENALKQNNIEINFDLNIARGVDYLWKHIRKDIVGPAFLINHPKYLSPLQKPSKDNPMIVERFQPIIAGSELGNGWSELNDPIEQFERFAEQQKLRDEGDEEAQWMDIDYVEMLEYGMPPTFGWGHSERVFWFLEDVPAREGVPFPQLKHELDPISKKIYGIK